jgi:hypothetical protein
VLNRVLQLRHSVDIKVHNDDVRLRPQDHLPAVQSAAPLENIRLSPAFIVVYELLCPGGVFQNLPSGIEPVPLRLAQIHHDDVRPKSSALIDRVASGGRFAADLPAFVAFKERTDASTHDCVIVDNQDPHDL